MSDGQTIYTTMRLIVLDSQIRDSIMRFYVRLICWGWLDLAFWTMVDRVSAEPNDLYHASVDLIVVERSFKHFLAPQGQWSLDEEEGSLVCAGMYIMRSVTQSLHSIEIVSIIARTRRHRSMKPFVRHWLKMDKVSENPGHKFQAPSTSCDGSVWRCSQYCLSLPHCWGCSLTSLPEHHLIKFVLRIEYDSFQW